MKYVVRDRKGKESILEEGRVVKFFYGTFVGRCFVKIFSFSIFSKIIGLFLNSRISKFLIKGFINKNNIDMSYYENKEYKSFNDFFIRQKSLINCNMDKNIFISPSDAKLMCYEINENSEFKIKNSYYKLFDLLDGNPVYKDYIGGYLLVFRLCADDYHRYIYIDNGVKEKNVFIKGRLNTVRPIAFEHIDVYKTNSREYTILHTENFGDVIEVEVGAVLIGKISNLHENHKFVKGEEKGMFEFGGSTIVLIIKKDKIVVDSDILENSKLNIETRVIIGERVGKKF